MGNLVVRAPAQMDSKYLSTVGDTMLEIPRVSQCDVGQASPRFGQDVPESLGTEECSVRSCNLQMDHEKLASFRNQDQSLPKTTYK